MATTKRVSLTPEQYARGFAAYQRRADERNRIGREWMQNQIHHLPEEPGPLTFMDVGTGTGKFAGEYCQMVLESGKFESVDCHTIEPHKEHQTAVLRNLRAESFQRCTFTHHCCRWTEYWKKIRAGRRFGALLARNVLYYEADWSLTVARMAWSLKPYGQGFIHHATPVGFNQILRWAKGWEADDPPATCLTLEQIAQGMEEMHIPYVKDEVQTDIEVTECLDPDNPHGCDYFSFLADEDMSQTDPARAAEARDFLRHVARPEYKGRELRWWLRHPFGAIRFQRPAQPPLNLDWD